jgi:hypothetical protein
MSLLKRRWRVVVISGRKFKRGRPSLATSGITKERTGEREGMGW